MYDQGTSARLDMHDWIHPGGCVICTCHTCHVCCSARITRQRRVARPEIGSVQTIDTTRLFDTIRYSIHLAATPREGLAPQKASSSLLWRTTAHPSINRSVHPHSSISSRMSERNSLGTSFLARTPPHRPRQNLFLGPPPAPRTWPRSR